MRSYPSVGFVPCVSVNLLRPRNQGAQASCDRMASIDSRSKLPGNHLHASVATAEISPILAPCGFRSVHTNCVVHAVDFVFGGALTRVFHVNTPGGDWRGRRTRTSSQRRRRVRDSEEGKFLYGLLSLREFRSVRCGSVAQTGSTLSLAYGRSRL